MKKLLGLGAALALVGGAGAWAQFSNTPAGSIPQVPQINATDLVPIIPLGQPSSQSYYAPAPLLGNYGATQAGNNGENAVIGGDATTNLFQRATTGSSVTTTLTYGGPDRWAYWSGTSTAMTVSRDTTAADLPAGYGAAFKMARTSGQTGVVQMCMAQQIETVNAQRFQSQTAELDFHAITGATFSGTALQAYIITGTGSDEAMNTMAFAFNAGGGGSSTWTGQTTAVSGSFTAGAGQAGRYTAVAPIAAGVNEVAVLICYTPVGTAGANDYVAVTGVQLVPNTALRTAAGTAGASLPVNDPRAKAFLRRSQAEETLLQQRYYYQITETATITPRAVCHVTTAGAGDGAGRMQCPILFPVPMRIAPTATYAAGFAGFTTTAETTATNCSALAIDDTVVFLNSKTMGLAKCSLTSSTIAVGLSMTLVDNSGSGTMKYSAEF